MAHSGIRDDGAYFVIVPSTRKITVPQSHKILGIVGDHNSEEITFQCPKTIDGHDVMNCTEHFVRFKNANGQTDDVDIPSNKITFDSDNIYLTWVISKYVTVASGNVSFSVHFVDKDDSDNITYRWGTTPCTECQILDGQIDDNPIDKPTIPDGYVKPEGTVTITANGTHNVAGKEFAEVQVGTKPPLQSKITQTNGTVEPDEGFYGLSKVIVEVPTGEDIELVHKDITANGTFYPSSDVDGFSSVNVNVKPNLQNKTVDKNGTVKADGDYDGLGEVTVDVKPNLQDKTVKANGEVTCDAGFDGLGTVIVDVPKDTEPDFVPEGTLPITSNGEHDVYNYAKVNVNVPVPEGYIKPSGSKDITTNGIHNVNSVVSVNVNVPNVTPEGYIKPVGSMTITSNGNYNVTEFKSVNVDVPEPSGNLNISVNGNYDVKDKATVRVDVPNVIPDEYVIPSGSMTITSNGEHDVYDKSKVNVDVFVPTLESKEITTNGIFKASDGTAYEVVTVNVEPKLQSKTISANEDQSSVTVSPDSGYDGLSKVTVNIARNDYSTQTKTITITKNETQHISPDSGYDGLSKVSVTIAIPEYDGTVS